MRQHQLRFEAKHIFTRAAGGSRNRSGLPDAVVPHSHATCHTGAPVSAEGGRGGTAKWPWHCPSLSISAQRRRHSRPCGLSLLATAWAPIKVKDLWSMALAARSARLHILVSNCSETRWEPGQSQSQRQSQMLQL